MDNKLLRYVGEKLYHLDILKEYKRYVVFRIRCMVNSSKMESLINFFEETPERKVLLDSCPFFIEQVTRSFFYKDSKIDERIKLVEEHVEILENKFNDTFFKAIYEPVETGKKLKLWDMDVDEKKLSMFLEFKPGQRKEGCLALTVKFDSIYMYQIMFWAAKDKEGNTALFVGALQGPQNANEEIKLLTKKCFGYRPKNLVFYGLRSFAKVLGIEKIYAVTTEGYFAMSGIRVDRKLKIDFSDFWKECEGEPYAADKRFYVMPVEEHRKDMSELKPSKRAQHRRRFEMLDSIDASVEESLREMLNYEC